MTLAQNKALALRSWEELVNRRISDLQIGEKLALAFVDIDHFKQVNDLYGHAVGDGLLVWVADRMRSQIRGSDLIGRISGDVRSFEGEVGVVTSRSHASAEGVSFTGSPVLWSPELGVEVCHDMPTALRGADVVMSLRMKHEYLKDHFVPNLDEYTKRFFISERLLSAHAPECVVLAPGPFVRGVEIESGVIDGPRSLYAKQVENGVAVRMAVLFLMVVARGDEQVVEEHPGAQA